jgi:integrase
MIRQRAGGAWEIRIAKKGLLPKDHHASAATEAEARAYAATIEAMLAQGIVPLELLQQGEAPVQTVDVWLRQYLVGVHISDSDNLILNGLLAKAGTWRTSQVNMDWARAWVSEMKRADKISPSTIRKKVGAVARGLDWCVNNGWLTVNPLRALPKRYSCYTPSDGDKKTDVERDRRLEPGEYERIMAVLDTDTRIKDRPAWRLLFILAIETGMRLREMYTLTPNQVDLKNRTIFLDKTKNGDKRQVPLSSVALVELGAWLGKIPLNPPLAKGEIFDSPPFSKGRNIAPFEKGGREAGGFVFPFWDGGSTPAALKLTTTRLSHKWARIAGWAGCKDLHFHDLRGEAASRFYERTNLSDVQIAKILGHRDVSMLVRRYARLRASDMAVMLW